MELPFLVFGMSAQLNAKLHVVLFQDLPGRHSQSSILTFRPVVNEYSEQFIKQALTLHMNLGVHRQVFGKSPFPRA